jgi:2-C-methyl-D-erythritol 2,4-cyclodiphosphate synthase
VTRVGIGYDIHRLKTGRPLLLGGIQIPHPFGLDGHSDADVVIHALMDALLGAAALGDIGHHFPPSDPTFKDASSVVMLRQVVRMLKARGYRVGNADITVVAEQPKISPYIDTMRAELAQVLGVALQDIGIQATTNEGLGPEGRGEGISAHAIACLEPVN